jgi:hypothetical protein
MASDDLRAIICSSDKYGDAKMADQTPKAPTPAYISHKAFTKFINGLRDGHLTTRIDRSMLTHMSGGGQSSLLGALEFLGLIDSNGTPQPALEELVTLSGAQYNAKLKSILTPAYSFLLDSLDLKRATASQVHEAFRKQNVQGSTAVKAVAFFLAAAKDAGIEVSKHVKPPSIVKSSSPKRNSARASARDEDEEDDDEDRGGGNGGAFTPDVHPALAGILLQLPPPGQTFNTKERTRFLKAFEAVLSLVYPDDDDNE